MNRQDAERAAALAVAMHSSGNNLGKVVEEDERVAHLYSTVIVKVAANLNEIVADIIAGAEEARAMQGGTVDLTDPEDFALFPDDDDPHFRVGKLVDILSLHHPKRIVLAVDETGGGSIPYAIFGVGMTGDGDVQIELEGAASYA